MYQFTGQGQDLLAQARQLHTESNDFRAKRRYERAVNALELAFKLRKTALISPHAVLTATIDSLAHLYQEMGNNERWHHYAKLSVEEKVSMVGELHVETQSALDNLHDACVAMGDFEGAAEARRRNWHARTSVLGIKDEAVEKNGVVGDIERMLDYWRKIVPSIRRSVDAEAEITNRLHVRQIGEISTQKAVEAAQMATNALMHCDFNDRRPVKRDPELEQLLAARFTEADYVLQFGKAPDPRWKKKENELYVNSEGQPATPPNEEVRGPKIPSSKASNAGDTKSEAGTSSVGGAPDQNNEQEEEEEGENNDVVEVPPNADEEQAPPPTQ